MTHPAGQGTVQTAATSAIEPAPGVAVAVVVVNYRTPQLVVALLKSLADELPRVPSAKVVVVDNASGDDSGQVIPEAIRELGFADWCQFHALPVNGGFGYGNNEGIRRLRESTGQIPGLIWILNPDTVVLPGALVELQRFMERRPEVAIAGGRIENPDGSARRSAFRFISPLGELEAVLSLGLVSRLLSGHAIAIDIPVEARKVDWVGGASMMIRGDVFERLGGFDEGYFLYFEETDLCLRANRAGHACWHVPESRIVHFVGQSTGVTGTGQRSKRRPAYWFESRRRYYTRNFGRTTYWLANILWLLAFPIGRCITLLRGRKPTDPPMLWWDFLRHS